MKKGWAYFFSLTAILGAIIFGLGIYARTITRPKHLRTILGNLDIAGIVESELGTEYAFVGELLDTPELKSMISSYTDGLVDYITEGKEEIPISKEEIRDLLTHYSGMLWENYPHLSFLPKDEFVDFLVDHIDLAQMLPSYGELTNQIPEPYLILVRFFSSASCLALSLALFLFSSLLLFLTKVKRVDYYYAAILAIPGIGFGLLGVGRSWLFSIFHLADAARFQPIFETLLAYFVPLAASYIGCAILVAVIGHFAMRRRCYV